MKLHYREFGGEGPPIVILHGLFASSRNWISAGKALTDRGRSFALDMRNHGDSPHSDSHTLEDLVDDLHEWLTDHGLERPVLVGHSMGGLAAMGYSLTHPQALRGLVVVDIAPRPYQPDFRQEFAALSTDISALRSRNEIDEALKPMIPDDDVRQFLAMNAERADGGSRDEGYRGAGYRWKIHVAALQRSPFMDGPDFTRFESHLHGRSEVPALLIAGGESAFVREEDIPLFRKFFPNGTVEVIPGCGHWVHYICSDSFLRILRGFLSGLEGAPRA